MKPEDHVKFTETLAGICEIWDKEMTSTLVDIYWESLKSFPISGVLNGLMKVAKTHKYGFPKPSDILEAIQGSSDGLAAEAMHHLVEAIGRVGAYQSVEFEDPGLQAVVEAWGGWPAVCGKTDEEWKYLKKDFLQIYELGKDRRHVRRHFAGLTEGTNRDTGHLDQIAPPVLVGAENGRLRIGDGSKIQMRAPEAVHGSTLGSNPYPSIPQEKKRLRLDDSRHIAGTLKSAIGDLAGKE